MISISLASEPGLFMANWVPMGQARGAGDGIVAPGGAKRRPGFRKSKTIRAPLGGAKEIALYPPVRYRSTARSGEICQCDANSAARFAGSVRFCFAKPP